MSDTKELIERLRSAAWGGLVDVPICDEAADTIARLEAERDAARREAMEECVRMLDAEHERSKHMHNYAACYARAIRAAMP